MMIRCLLPSVLLLILSACAPPPDLSPLDAAGGAIIAKKVSGELPLDPDNKVWREAVPSEVPVYPQRSVAPASSQTDILSVRVQALHNGKELALRLEWKDDSPAEQRDIGQFVDAAAVQWPVQYGPGVRLPYVGMGHSGYPVAVWFWRADGSTETLAAEGFGTLTAQNPDGVTAEGVWKDGFWRVVFKRVFAASGEQRVTLMPETQGLVPVALAIWNGEQEQRNGLKRLSAWRVLYLEKTDADPSYIQQLADKPSMQGDPESGKRLMIDKGCIACHAFPDNPAQPTIGPGLHHAGGILRAAYLLESIVEPSKVVVPGKG
ncbi:MAG: c-type cytochrome, partial [Gammaproteobacteria bacterium]|nr:c-type cytochrome [Gammaproteobacteria bacterium]